jgi:peptidylprolyl isomerase
MSVTLRTLFAGLIVVAGCASASREVATDYAPELGVDLQRMTRNASGLYWMDITPGSGPAAAAGQTVRVIYIGYLTNGARFDAAETAPISFVLGRNEVIRGWDEGITGMRPGGRRKLVIPAHLGYGTAGRTGRIPGNATLVFDIQLVDARD